MNDDVLGVAFVYFYVLLYTVYHMVVRMRHTRGHTRNRRSHHALTNVPVVKTKGDGIRLNHTASKETGTYKGKPVKALQRKLDKKIAKKTPAKTAKKKAK